MRVLQCCLSCFYIDGYSYQENELIREHVKLGHEVLVIASTESFDDDQNKTYVEPGEYIGNEGARVIRLPFAKWLPFFLMRKVKAYSGFMNALESFSPDIIMFHGCSSYELLTVSKYKKRHPNALFYADSHADKNNSGKGFLSKNLLHKMFYKWVVQKSLAQIKKVLCISIESKNFCSEIYAIPETKLEFYPLGGYVFNDEEYLDRRNRLRQEYALSDDATLFLQTGKFDEKKKLVDSLKAFLVTQNSDFKFFIAGVFLNSVEKQASPLIYDDERVSFLGWKDSEAMKDLLCAADVYVQPGSQSATMQMSLCARCPVILDDVESHRVFIEGNGWLVNSNEELKKAFISIEKDLTILKKMSHRSLQISEKMLDYKNLAQRILV
jgi:1,2-diacylglycerol 3-alpha-glucosyltransferase